MPLPMSQLMHTLLASQMRQRAQLEQQRQVALQNEMQMGDRVRQSSRRTQDTQSRGIQQMIGAENQQAQQQAFEQRRQGDIERTEGYRSEDQEIAEGRNKFAQMMALEKQGLSQDQFSELQVQNQGMMDYKYDAMASRERIAEANRRAAGSRARTMVGARDTEQQRRRNEISRVEKKYKPQLAQLAAAIKDPLQIGMREENTRMFNQAKQNFQYEMDQVNRGGSAPLGDIPPSFGAGQGVQAPQQVPQEGPGMMESLGQFFGGSDDEGGVEDLTVENPNDMRSMILNKL